LKRNDAAAELANRQFAPCGVLYPKSYPKTRIGNAQIEMQPNCAQVFPLTLLQTGSGKDWATVLCHTARGKGETDMPDKITVIRTADAEDRECFIISASTIDELAMLLGIEQERLVVKEDDSVQQATAASRAKQADEHTRSHPASTRFRSVHRRSCLLINTPFLGRCELLFDLLQRRAYPAPSALHRHRDLRQSAETF
jgi:hypothetical protein